MKLGDIPLNDPKTYQLLSKGLNVGIFQLNSGWVKGLLRSAQPERFEDIVALTALIRPGAMDSEGPREYVARKKIGQTRPDIHPEIDSVLEPILKETYGLVVYQEQVMEIIKVISGWDYAEADLIFRALKKKDLAKMEKAKPAFYSAATNYSTEALDRLWDILIPFSDYSFGKAHSVGYSYITYWNAYLKTHYPEQFLTALLSSTEDQSKILTYIAEANRLGIAVLPPDINESGRGFVPTKKGVRYGFAAIRDVGESATEGVTRQRPFVDLDDFFRRTDPKVLNSRVLSALIRAGAFDSLWPNREGLLESADRVARLTINHRRLATFGERPLLRVRYTPRTPKEAPWTPEKASTVRQQELETLGVHLTHPRLILRAPRVLSESENHWLTQVLEAREPNSEVWIEAGSTRIQLPVRSSSTGLAEVVKMIGLELREE